MNAEVEAIFLYARDLPVGEQTAYVHEACGTDAMRAEVARLLDDAQAADSYFLDSIGGMEFTKQGPMVHMEKTGDHIGPYVLVRELGEGGFGVVWEARQSRPISRRVALKVIKAGMDTEEVLLRFDAERQALARMDHPHIAKVLHAGATPHGRPYFSMELVAGEPITAYCGNRGLDTKARLALFREACSAIHHAHQKGVIHRDIKPSNVLVAEDGDGAPSVKVIDFGVAKAIQGRLTEASLHTRQEQWLGTPAYMSPEQAGLDHLDIDTRSDIYSLGVLLYELLAGEAPFVPSELLRRSYEEIRRIIREEEPPRLTARLATTQAMAKRGNQSSQSTGITETGKTCISELDWIVTKAMEKHRERRYQTVDALADDIECHLNHRPVMARPPSAGYMLMKFAHRHRMGIHIASAFLVLLIGAVLMSTLLALRARDAESRAQEQLAAAIADRNAKNLALSDAEEVSRLLSDILERLRPAADGRSVPLAQAINDVVVDLDSRFASQPKRAAMLKDVLAGTFENLGSLDRSYALRKEIFENHQELHGLDHPQTRLALRKLMDTARTAGKSQAALEHALLHVEILGKTDANSREMESAKRAVVSGWFAVGERERAIEAQRELVTYCRDRFGARAQEVFMAAEYLRQLEAPDSRTALIGASTEKHADDAIKQVPEKKPDRIAEAQQNFKMLVESSGSEHPATVNARNLLADRLISENRHTEAAIHLEQIAARSVEWFGPLDERNLNAQIKLARCYGMIGQMDKAFQIQKRVVDAIRERDGETAESTIRAEDELVSGLFNPRERSGVHVQYLVDLLESRIKRYGADHESIVRPHESLASWAYNTTDYQRAIHHCEAAIRIMRANPGKHKNATTSSAMYLALAFAKTGRTREAIDLMVEYRQQIRGFSSQIFTLASLQLWTGDLDGYRETRKELFARESTLKSRGEGEAMMIVDHIWLATMAALDDENQGLRLLTDLDRAKKIIELVPKRFSSDDYEMNHGQTHGLILFRLGRYEDALKEFNQSIRRIDLNSNSYNAWDYRKNAPWVYSAMAMAYHRLGNKDEATRSLKAAESFLSDPLPSAEHPLKDNHHGGEWLMKWIFLREAKALISGGP